jgi:DNA sulfur modification protein DndC
MRRKISIRKKRCASEGGGAERNNMRNQSSFFEDMRLTLDDSIALSVTSLTEYGRRYRHWAIAYSGGKDSTATVTFVVWAIRAGLVPAPASLTVLYADTRMELPPLQQSAVQLLATLSAQGISTQVVLPRMDDRFFVYMLGRGVPPPSNTFRWCTSQLKIEPMHIALAHLRQQCGEKLLMLTGVRLGESAARDQRIALSCSKDSGECGQGWFQIATPDSMADTLAPLLHWRLCHVYDWLYFEDGRHGYDVTGIAAIYGEDDVRTGCVGCNLASRDNALERLLRKPEWSHLSPLLELRPLYAELKLAKNRKRKAEPELRKDGKFATNVQRLGPLTMAARQMGLDRILDIQQRTGVDLVNAEESTAIRQMWRDNVWPNKWTSNDIDGDTMIDALTVTSWGDVISQPVLLKGIAA